MITPNHLSILGIIHTAISILALLVAFWALFRSGRIDPLTGPGKRYIWLTIITCVTGLPIMRFGHPTGGHYLAIIILILLPIGIFARRMRFLGKLGEYVQVFVMSTTLFLSCIPLIIESLTRLPISHPIAYGPDDPLLKNALTGLLVIYAIGVIYQLIRVRTKHKTPPSLNKVVN
ncbi:MAG: hypothetical protein JST50_05915 [Bacteroidetes bacterium]|jgi:hypothetical protein|nr:hypothetical protein [Bacteroidota bacterium]